MLDELNDLGWGFGGSYGGVLTRAGLFKCLQRGQAWDWFYEPTADLWELFATRPPLATVLPALEQLVLADAYERCTLDGSGRRAWAESRLRRLGITAEGLEALRRLIRMEGIPDAATLATRDGAVRG